MIPVSINFITFFVTFKRMLFYVDGSFNVWLEPRVFEFGKPATLHCNVTEQTTAIAWWIVGGDRSPKKISNEMVLNFASANHSHSAIYECFHTFKYNGFQKYSRKVLVLETHCSKYICSSENFSNAQELINWKFIFSAFPFDDIYFECNETKKSCYNLDGRTLKDVNFASPALTTCSVGFENSKVDLNECRTNETLYDRLCNLSCFLNLDSKKENDQDENALLQVTPMENADKRRTTKLISISLNNNVNPLHVILLVTASVILAITIVYGMAIALARSYRGKHSDKIYDFREDEDDNEIRDALADECRTATKSPKMASKKKMFCFIKNCRGSIVNWC